MKIEKTKLLSLSLLSIFIIGCGDSSNNTNIERSDKNITENHTPHNYKNSAYLASSEADYNYLGIKRNHVEAWEDALRTDGKSGSFEWWYSDFLFSDGTSVVVVFYTKLSFDTYGSAQPMATIHIKTPDGKHDREEFFLEQKGHIITASKTSADVHIGKSYLSYREKNYQLHFEKGDLIFDASMRSLLPMTRPKTGHIFFGEDREKYLAWLPAQALSEVNATLKEYGKPDKTYVGAGYHDHNWGNTSMNEIINSWYWGRGVVGDYSIIFSEIIATQEYSQTKIPFFILAKKNNFIEMNSSITVEKNDFITHPKTHKSYAKSLTFSQKDSNGITYTINTQTKKDLLYLNMNILPFEIGNHPTYLSSKGDINLTITEKNGDSEQYQGQGIWEQISFDDTIIK